MATPQWKVYRGKEYVASCKYPYDAWLLCSEAHGRSMNAIVRYGHDLVVWREFNDGLPYMTADLADDLMRKRVADKFAETNKKLGVTASPRA